MVVVAAPATVSESVDVAVAGVVVEAEPASGAVVDAAPASGGVDDASDEVAVCAATYWMPNNPITAMRRLAVANDILLVFICRGDCD